MIKSFNSLRLDIITINEKIGQRVKISVIMQEDTVALSEMVVTGYGAKKEMVSDSYSRAAPASASYGGRHPFPRYNSNFNTEGYAGIE